MVNAHAGAAGPAAIMQMMQAAQSTAVLAAAVELGLFAIIADSPLDEEAVAERLGCPARSTRILLDALGVLGLMTKDGAKYALSAVAAEHLVPGKPKYMGDLTNVFANPIFWSALPRLSEAVKNGGTVMDAHVEAPQHPFWEAFAKSSAAMAFPSANALNAMLTGWISSKPTCRVLDIAAGSGIYGLTLAKHPNVELTALDWPNVLEKTRGWATRLGVDARRVSYLPGNLFDVDYGGPYDLVLLSHVYHHFDPSTCAALTKKVATALPPRGRLAVQDFVYDAGLENPAAAMFSVAMLMLTRNGESYAVDEYRRWFVSAGLSDPDVHPVQGLPSTWLLSEKT